MIEIRGEPAPFLQSPVEDSRFTIRLTSILGVVWLWRATFDGYGASESDRGLALSRQAAETAAERAVFALRRDVLD